MLSEKMQEALNDQINKELWSSYLYLSMSAYFEDRGLPGFANWMKVQAQEEVSHAMKFFNYINDRGGRVILKPIVEVPSEWTDTKAVVEETLNHEKLVSSYINNLVDQAIKEKDHATNNMLQWFVEEQVEEEASVSELLDKVEMTEGKPHVILNIDKELGQRVFVDETKEG